jgi:hypothetical protein
MTVSPHDHLVRRWTTCPITVRAATLVPEARRPDFVRWLLPHSEFAQEFVLRRHASDPRVDALWDGVAAIRFDGTVTGSIGCEIVFDTEPGVHLRYHVRRFSGLDDMPEAVRATLVGMPMTTVVAHPLLEGSVFEIDDEWGEILGPDDVVDLGANHRGASPGAALLSMADAALPEMARHAARLSEGRGG